MQTPPRSYAYTSHLEAALDGNSMRSLPGSNGDNRLAARTLSPSLTFPLRPLKSPKVRKPRSAKKTRSWFSGGYFRVQISATGSAKKPRSGSLFQRLPTAPDSVFALGWPIQQQQSAKDGGLRSFNRLVREQSVPLFRQEALVRQGTQRALTTTENALIRRLSAEIMQLRSILALVYHPVNAVSGPLSLVHHQQESGLQLPTRTGHATPDSHRQKEFNKVLQRELETWLDVESKYRLTVEQVEATEGATYARDEYEKWNTAFKDASRALADTLARLRRNTNSSAQTSQTREAGGRTREMYHPRHAVPDPPSTGSSVNRQVYRQEIGLNGHATPEAGGRTRALKLELERELKISLQKVSELESLIRNATSSAETPSSQASAGGGQQSSFPAAVELDPSRAALKNNEALSRQNNEHQIKPADLEQKDKESRLSVELDQAKQESQQQLHSQLQSLLASKDKEIESYKSKEKEYEALKKENDMLKKQVAGNEILKQKLTSTQEEYAQSESQGEVVVKELAAKENIENTTSEHALAALREELAQSKAELEQAKQESQSLQLTLQKERAEREQHEREEHAALHAAQHQQEQDALQPSSDAASPLSSIRDNDTIFSEPLQQQQLNQTASHSDHNGCVGFKSVEDPREVPAQPQTPIHPQNGETDVRGELLMEGGQLQQLLGQQDAEDVSLLVHRPASPIPRALLDRPTEDAAQAQAQQQLESLALASKLADFISQTEKLSLEDSFDVIARSYGEMSLFDLKTAIARVCNRITFTSKRIPRETVENLYKIMDTRGTGLVTKEDWCQILKTYIAQDSPNDLSFDIRLDSPHRDDPRNCEDISVSRSNHREVYRTKEECRLRTLQVISVADCVHILSLKVKEELTNADLKSMVQIFLLDLTPEDVSDLFTEDYIKRSNMWKEAEKDATKLVEILTIIASALVWDIRSVSSAYLFLITSGNDEGAPVASSTETIVPDTISKEDLIQMNDALQFCLSIQQVDLLFRYLDSSHNGNISLQSWLRALNPFCTAIKAMGRCLHHLVEVKKESDSEREGGAAGAEKLFQEFDRDSGGKLTLDEFKKSLEKELLTYPEAHVKIFHTHLTYFTSSDSGAPSVLPSHWSAAFDLITCDEISSTNDMSYTQVLLDTKRIIAMEHFAALVISLCEKEAGVKDTMRWMEKVVPTGEICLLKPSHLADPLKDLKDLQWHLLCQHEYPPGIDSETESCPNVLASAVVGLRKKMAMRGAQLLVVLLASHKLSIDAAFTAFCVSKSEHITFDRFAEILERLAPDFGNSSGRIGSLFLSFADSSQSSVCKDKWSQVLQQAAGHLKGKQFYQILLKDSTKAPSHSENHFADKQLADKDLQISNGEREHLRNVFLGKHNCLFINRDQLKESLAKMGCAMEEDLKTMDSGKTIYRQGRRKRGETMAESSAEERMDNDEYTLWDFERKVEQSRLSSTFAQMKLHEIFGKALSVEMQPENGICTPLAIEQLQSEHLMSWMLSLGKNRLEELIGRMYDLKRGDVIKMMVAAILDFHTKQEKQTKFGNSKYSTWAGAFAGETKKACFGKLDDFKKGLDRHLGMPSFNVKQQMYREHCLSHDSHIIFSPPNHKNIKTCPADEYDYVLNYDPAKEYPGGGDRTGGDIHDFMKHANAKAAGLTVEEAAALRLYSGPMYTPYNAVLRGGKKQFITTIHAIVSGIIKLASIMKLPSNRKLYRGLSGFELPEEFWNEDKYGARGGVEFGIMSTTTSKQVAIQYSSHGTGRVPTVFEIEIGQVDRGAVLKWISQFPGEEEVVLPPLSNLEVIGAPYLTRLEVKEGVWRQILVVPLRVNVNIKSKTMEELVSTRRDVLLSAIKDMQAQSEQDIGELAQAMGEIDALSNETEPEWFNDQVAHRRVNQERSSDTHNKEIMLKRRRKDLLELVTMRVGRPVTVIKNVGEGKGDDPILNVRHITNKIISLEQQEWRRTAASEVSNRKSGSSLSKHDECKQYVEKNALQLELACKLCPDLKDVLSLSQVSDLQKDEFFWEDMLNFCKKLVDALDSEVGVQFGALISDSFDQLAFQIRVEQTSDECLLAVGVFPEEAFNKDGSISKNELARGRGKEEVGQNDILQAGDEGGGGLMEAGVLGLELGGGCPEEEEEERQSKRGRGKGRGQTSGREFFILRGMKDEECLKNEGCHSGISPSMPGMDGGVAIAIRIPPSGGTKKNAGASKDGIKNIAKYLTTNAISESKEREGESMDPPSFEDSCLLDKDSNLYIVLDSEHNLISFHHDYFRTDGSVESRHIGNSHIDGSKGFHAAAVRLSGCSDCKVHIESVPILYVDFGTDSPCTLQSLPKSTFFLRHFDDMTKTKAVEAVENLKETLHAQGMIYEEKSVKCSRGHSMCVPMSSARSDWRCDECLSVFENNSRVRCDKCDFNVCGKCFGKNGKGVLKVKNSKFENEKERELEFMWAAFGSYDGSCIVDVATVLCDPEHADKELCNAEQLKGKVAFVKRGVNDFSEKAQRAQVAGAVAVVIINTGRDASNRSDEKERGLLFRAGGASEEESASAVTIPVLMVAAHSAATLLAKGSQVTLVSKYAVLLDLLRDDVKSSDDKGSGAISSADAIDKDEGLSGTFYRDLVKVIGEEWARVEFISMLVMWKKTRYHDIKGLKDKFKERARVIECCKSTLKSIYTTHADDKAREERKREKAQEQTVVSAQESILGFFKTLDLYGCVQAMLRFYPSKKNSEKKWKDEIIEIVDLFSQIKDIAYELLEIVDIFVKSDFENSQEADYTFSLILEKMYVLVDGIFSSLHMLQKAEDVFQQMAPEEKKPDVEGLKSEDANRDLTDAYDLGGISAKQSQAIARATAAHECFTRLDPVCTEQGLQQFKSASHQIYHYGDLLWICNTSLLPELWLLDRNLYKADHADRLLAWLNRQCAESELLRFVKHLDDASLQSPTFRRRFLEMLNTLEAACKVLPLTSANCYIPTRRRFQSVKKDLKQFLEQGAGNMSEKTSVQTRLKDGKARIKKRWNIGDRVGNRTRKGLESKSEDQIQKEKPQEECAATGNSGGQMQDFDNTSGWEFWRADARYWEARTLLCSQELIRLNQNRQQKPSHVACTRRSVMRCLELLDDTVYNFASSPNETAVRDSNGISINLQDTADEWEARLLGMLSLRHISCKLNQKSVVVGNMGTKSQSDNLHIGDLASGVQRELHLHEPDAKVAAFLASFLARASQDTVRVFLCDKIGNPLTLHESSSTESPPIVLVPGGGLTAHISTDESGKKILDFSGKGLSVYHLRLLVEAARADEDIVQATIAGVDMDFCEEYYAQKKIERKTLFSEMSLQSNRFGEKDSEESMRIICDIISISASNLQTINLSSNKINSAAAGIIAKFFKQGARALKRLVLSDNLLENEGIEYLSKSVQGIEYLDFSKNKIKWEGALHLAEAISSQQCHVTELNLAGNSLGSQGLVALAASLSCNRSIRSLNLSFNEIGDIGVDALAHKWPSDALAHKWPSEYALHLLTSLDLSENEITALGAGKLFGADFDKLAPKLSDLSLSSNRISHTGIMKIATRLAACKNLDKLCLETQKPLNEVSEFNEHQLFVMGGDDLSSDDESITEQQAKFKLVSEIKFSITEQQAKFKVVSEIKLLCTTLLSEKKYTLRAKNSKLEREEELKCIRAAFGSYDGSSIVDVAAVLCDPEHADKELCNAEQLKGKVAVVKGDFSNFFEKAQRAQVAGAVAVVIINTDSTLFTASAGDDVHTSAVMIPVLMVAADSASTLLTQGGSRVTYAHTFPVMATTSVLEGISLFCEPNSFQSLSQEEIEKMKKGVEGKKQKAKKGWEGNAGKRSKAMKGLKDAWRKAGKPLSHLNRQDLSRQSKEALTGLVECAHTMRTKEPAYYLLDTNYTKALNESLEVRRKCVDDFRKNLSASLLKPLRSMTGGKGNSKIILHTQGMKNEGKGSLRMESSFATLERSIRKESLVYPSALSEGNPLSIVRSSQQQENILEVKNSNGVKELKIMRAYFGSYRSCIVDVATIICGSDRALEQHQDENFALSQRAKERENPEHADKKIRNAEQLKGNVAVVRTSGVDNFFEQAQRAQNAGAVAVVIIDTESTLFTASAGDDVDKRAVTIPVLVVAADSASTVLDQGGSRVTWSYAHTVVAGMILEQEMKCRSLKHVVEFQRAFKKKKEYQDAFEHAKRANNSANVHVNLIRNIIIDQAAFKSMWQGKIADERVRELAHLTLDALVQQKMEGLLPELNDTNALQLLKAEDSKRKDQVLEVLKKEDSERHRQFEVVLERLKQFFDGPAEQEQSFELPVEQLDTNHRKLLGDLCYSHYNLTCRTEKRSKGVDIGHQTLKVERSSFSSSFSDKPSFETVLVIDRKQKGEEPKDRLETKEKVKDHFENNPGFKAAWAASSELMRMWNVNDLSGSGYASEPYSEGSPEYWREVGWLVSNIPLQKLSELSAQISKDQADMWLERWQTYGSDALIVKNSTFEKEKELEFIWADFGSYDGSCINDVAAVLCEPEHADKELCNAEQLKGNVAVVKRGVNDFFEKAQRAQVAGAVAVVIINTGRDASNRPDDSIFRPSAGDDVDTRAVTIPVVMVAADSASILLAQGGSRVTYAHTVCVKPDLCTVIKKKAEAFYKNNSTVDTAYALCRDLREVWDKGYFGWQGGLVGEFRAKIGGEKGELACLLEIFRMMKKVVAVMEGSEEDRVKGKGIEAIVEEMRDYCSKELPRLSQFYFDEKAAGPLLHHPVRLARQRVKAVRQHLEAAELFKTETTKEGPFCSPVLVSLLSEAVQYDESLRQLQVLSRRLAFDTYISECKDRLSLPVAIAANAPVFDKTVSFEQHWHENPQEESRCYSVKKRLESSCLDSRQAWSPAISAGGVWMEMDLGAIKSVAGVVTQCSYVRRVQNDQILCKIEVEHRTRKEQEWVATELNCFECKSGDQKVEHVFVDPIEVQHVRIHVKEFNGDISMRAGVLKRPRTKIQGEIVSVKSEAAQSLVAFAIGAKWVDVGVKTPMQWCRRNHMLSVLSAGDKWKCGVCSTGPQTYNPRLRCDTCDFDVCKTCSSTGNEIGNEKLAAALRHKVEFSQQELDEFEISNLTYASYIKVEDRYFQPAVLETTWCKIDDLVDVKAAELASSLEDHFARELARLKDLYQEGGATGKRKQVLERAVKMVRSRLEGELQTWENEAKKLTDEEKQERADVQSLSQPHEDWLKMVFDSSHYAFMNTFWNLDSNKPKGIVSELDTHTWYFLRQFLEATGKAIERQKSIFAAGGIQWDFLAKEVKSEQKLLWEDRSAAIVFSPDKSVAESENESSASVEPAALGTTLTEGSISLQFVEGSGDAILGVALEGYDVSKDWRSEHTILVVIGKNRSGHPPIIRNDWKEELSLESKGMPEMGVGDTVRVAYAGKCIEFFANHDATPWFSVEDVTGQVRPLAIFCDGGKVKLARSAQLTRKRLALFCTKTQDAKETRACSAEDPCDLCVQECKKRASDLLNRLGSDLYTALRDCVQEAARVKHQKKALDFLRKEIDKICLTVSEEQDMDGRVEAALNGLPSALLAEPQCCQRMTAAVYCLAAAVHALPLVRTDLPTRFLVPPLEPLAGTPHVLRCVEMLEMGTASRFQPSQRCKPYVWAASFPPKSVELSENSRGRVEFSEDESLSTLTEDCSAEGTLVENGSFVFTLESVSSVPYFWIGVAFEGYDITKFSLDPESENKRICLDYSGNPDIQGEAKRGQWSRLKAGDTIRVKHDRKFVEILVNDETRCGPVGVQGPVRPLVINRMGKLTIRLSGGQMQAVKKQAVLLSMDQATESLPFQTILDLTPWEARVFGSLCVSPYKLTTPSGEVALQQLAAGELADVTLQAVDLTGPLAAFLAHFVARCCKEEVRVKIVLSGKNGDEHVSSEFILRPGGGLEGHLRKDASQKAASAAASGPSQDRVLVLSNMGVDVAALHLLMEAALAGLKEAAVPDRASAEASKVDEDKNEADGDKNEADGENETSERETAHTHTKKQFEQLLKQSKKTLTTRLKMADGSRSLDGKRMVKSIELNQNPLIGEGKDLSMKLIVQIAHLTAGQCLLRLHLDNNNIEDEGIRALADAFTRNRFAPLLEILWLSMNRITDDSVNVFGDALQKSLHYLVDLSLFQNNFSTKGRALLRRKTAHKPSLTLRL